MKKSIVLKSFLIVIALVCIFLFVKAELSEFDYEAKAMENVYLLEEIEGKEIVYTLWEALEMQSYYLVLPSMYSSMEIDFQIQYDDRRYRLYIDDKLYVAGETWKGLEGEEKYYLKIEDVWGRTYVEKPVQILISEKLPAMLFTVESQEALFDIQEYSNKRHVETGNVIMFDDRGKLLVDTELEKIAVRGNTSAELSKKPFRIEFKQPVSLCGMKEATKWNLIANAKDGTHIRNKLILDWADELGDDYNVQSDYVEVFINGEYQGLYLLTETVTLGENRLELNPENSVLAEMELYYRAGESDYNFSTEEQHYWVIHSEKYLEGNQIEEIKKHFDEIESALYAEDGKGKKTGKELQELIDFDSWTDAWLLEEISADVDLGTTSQFAYMEDWSGRSILKAGPEWDFDSTLGNSSLEVFRNPRNLVAAIPNTKGIECITQNRWLAPMYENELFRKMLIDKFQTEIRPKIADLLAYQIDDYIEIIRRPALLDTLRWRGNGIMDYTYESDRFAIPYEGDYTRFDVIDTNVDYMKEFLIEKENFLVELWIEGVEFEVIIEERNYSDMNLELNNDIYTWIRKDELEEKQ